MLIPQSLLTVQEYDATFTVMPTSKFDHDSDSVFASIEMLVVNDQQEDIEFPFIVLNTDSGEGALSPESVVPHVLNGSQPVDLGPGEVDESALAELMVQRAQAAGVADPAKLEEVRAWGHQVLARAERTHIGRTRIGVGQRRRIVLQHRIRVRPDETGVYVLEILAPSPIATIPTGGRISVVVLLPWEDEDVKPRIVPERTDQGVFEFEQGRIKMRQLVAWHWKNDPLLRLGYKYE